LQQDNNINRLARGTKKNEMKKSTGIKTLMLLMITLLAISCGQKKKGPALLLVATTENIATYSEGFKRYFNIINDASDAGKWISLQRYTIMINRDSPEPQDGCFLINISDNGSNSVHVNFAYTVGAKSANATVINPNMLSGSMSVNNSIDVALNADSSTSSAQKIAAAIYQKLVEIEGK